MNDALDYALKLLKRKDYYIKELYDRLKKKKIEDKNITSTIKILIKKDIINDNKLVYLKTRNMIIDKRFGKNYIYSYFKNKNISENLVAYTLNIFGNDIFNQNKEAIVDELKKRGKERSYIEYYLVKKGYDIY